MAQNDPEHAGVVNGFLGKTLFFTHGRQVSSLTRHHLPSSNDESSKKVRCYFCSPSFHGETRHIADIATIEGAMCRNWSSAPPLSHPSPKNQATNGHHHPLHPVTYWTGGDVRPDPPNSHRSCVIPLHFHHLNSVVFSGLASRTRIH